jgi:hypothetical protein
LSRSTKTFQPTAIYYEIPDNVLNVGIFPKTEQLWKCDGRFKNKKLGTKISNIIKIKWINTKILRNKWKE